MKQLHYKNLRKVLRVKYKVKYIKLFVKRSENLNTKGLLVTLLRVIWWKNFPGRESCHSDDPAVFAAGFRCAAGAGNFCSVPLENFVHCYEYKYFQSSLSLLSEDEMERTKFVCQFLNFLLGMFWSLDYMIRVYISLHGSEACSEG